MDMRKGNGQRATQCMLNPQYGLQTEPGSPHVITQTLAG
jgi:hypothetical protein